MKTNHSYLETIAVAFFALLTLTANLIASPTYNVVNLGTLGGTNSQGRAINNKGQIVGSSDTPNQRSHAFLYSGGPLADLGTLGGSNSIAFGINDKGEVVGRSDTSTAPYYYRTFLYSGGGMVSLGTLGGSAESQAWGINDNSQVVGNAAALPGGYHAFIHTGAGPLSPSDDIHTLGGPNSIAVSINQSGQAVGFSLLNDESPRIEHAMLYSGGVMTDLGTLGGGKSYAYAINSSGQVAGYSWIDANGLTQHAFLFDHGVMTDVGVLGGTNSFAVSLNDSGQMVGYFTVNGGSTHAFIYSGGVMIDLNSLIPTNSGWELLEANGINNLGQIVGTGLIGSRQRAFLLWPRPAPPQHLVAKPADGQVTLTWDESLDGATGYNVYVAQEPGLTKQNYQTLPGGRRISGAVSPFTVTGLTNSIYYFIVTALDESNEGLDSAIVSARVCFPPYPTGGTFTNLAFYAVTSDMKDSSTVYAAGGATVYKSVDCGITWNDLAGNVSGRDVRALAANGTNVYAATQEGDMLRSTDGGSTWRVVADGQDIGEQNKSLAIDPVNPAILYAGDFKLPTFVDGISSYMIKSVDRGATWFHVSNPISGEVMRSYTIGINPQAPMILYAGGTGIPLLARSTDGGSSWTEHPIGVGYVYALAIDAVQPEVVYAATQSPALLYKSTDGLSFAPVYMFGSGVNSLMVNPANDLLIHAGTYDGYYFSTNAGTNWTRGNGALPTAQSRRIRGITSGGPSHLIAATEGGIFLLDLKGNTPSALVQDRTLTEEPDFGGTVNKTPDQAGYAQDAVVTLSAIPQFGWGFMGWSGDATGTDNPLHVTMSRDKAIKANFASFTLSTSVSPEGSGTVTVSPNQPGYASNSIVTLTASPISGFEFYGWGGSASGTTSPLSVSMTANRPVTAYFVATAAPDLIVDNPDATFAGLWIRDTAFGSQYRSDYRYTKAQNGNNTAQFTPNLPVSGNYDVYVWYPIAPDASKFVAYEISSADGNTTVELSQALGGGAWQRIAAGQRFNRGTAGHVTLSGTAAESEKFVYADAVRFLYSSEQTSLPPILSRPVQTNGGLSLSWFSHPGSSYRVQFKSDLEAASWTDLEGDVLATSSTASKVDPGVGGAGHRFYRIVQLP